MIEPNNDRGFDDYTRFDSGISHGSESLAQEQKRISVTPDAMFKDNRSDLAQASIGKWRNNRTRSNLKTIEKCGDARSFEVDPTNSILLPSIAASGPIEPFIRVYRDPRVTCIVNMSHFTGSRMKRGVSPGGCGGRELRGQQLSNGSADDSDIDQFVEQYVPHSDVILNSVKRAQEIAKLTGKPIMAATQDHSSGRIYMLGAYFQYKEGKILSIDAGYNPQLYEGNYNPETLYEDGIPFIGLEDIPQGIEEFQPFKEMLEANREQIRALHMRFPDFPRAQEIQNPHAIILSTSIKPVRVRYQHTFGLPGTFFSIRFGRERLDGVEMIDEESHQAALNQAHYPISQSTAHFEKSNTSFSRTNRVIIETENMDYSSQLAHAMAEKPWMQDWLDLPDHRIIIAQNRAGELGNIDFLRPKSF